MKFKYKNETVEMPIKFTSLINDKKISELSELFNQRIAEGLELVSHSYIGTQTPGANSMYITFKTSSESTPAIEYKSEAIEIKSKWFGPNINENECAKLGELFIQRIAEGWELASHTFLSAGGGQTDIMFVTFKKVR